MSRYPSGKPLERNHLSVNADLTPVVWQEWKQIEIEVEANTGEIERISEDDARCRQLHQILNQSGPREVMLEPATGYWQPGTAPASILLTPCHPENFRSSRSAAWVSSA